MELAQKWLLLVRRAGWFKDARTQTNTPTFWRGVTVVHYHLVWLGSNCVSRYMSLKAAVMCHYTLIPCHDSARHWCRYVGGSDPCRWRQVTWTKISAKEIFKSYAAIKVVWSWIFDRYSTDILSEKTSFGLPGAPATHFKCTHIADFTVNARRQKTATACTGFLFSK